MMRIEAATGFPDPGTPGLFWLGQAGFWIETGAQRILIDPYLSDSLARKYAGQKNAHIRMMPPPVTVADLPRPDLVLVTHAHTDHMDAETLGPLHARFPELPFVVPAARMDLARQRIGEGARLIGADAGQDLSPLPGLGLRVFPAAHEDRQLDDQGRHVFLGYGIATGGMRLYHSGDCVPFAGLQALVDDYAPDIALLPVNGRDAQRRADGVPGNFTLDEAIALARDCAFLVPHHFDMFSFNTIDPRDIDVAASGRVKPAILRPLAGGFLRIVT